MEVSLSDPLSHGISNQRNAHIHVWWRLAQIKGIGPVILNDLWQQLSSSGQLFEYWQASDRPALQQLGLKSAAIELLLGSALTQGWGDIERWCSVEGQGLLFRGDEDYPSSLAALRDAPIVLFYRGNRRLLGGSKVAIVGSRQHSHYGNERAVSIAQSLANHYWVVVSGLALGIDAAAHLGVLQSGQPGATVAVLGSGLDQLYPKQHVGLAKQVLAKGGLLLSEHMPKERARAEYFPRRNRIVSGLSQGVLVVEAALKSGSLITARLAAEQGREVFAIPGPVTHPLSHGCHQLIREGAHIVEHADDILAVLGDAIQLPVAQQPTPQNKPALDHDAKMDHHIPEGESPWVNLLDASPKSLDQLVGVSGLSVAELTQQLMLLELKGQIKQVPGGYVKA